MANNKDKKVESKKEQPKSKIIIKPKANINLSKTKAKVDFKKEIASIEFDKTKIDNTLLISTVNSIGDNETYKVIKLEILSN